MMVMIIITLYYHCYGVFLCSSFSGISAMSQQQSRSLETLSTRYGQYQGWLTTVYFQKIVNKIIIYYYFYCFNLFNLLLFLTCFLLKYQRRIILFGNDLI